MAHKHINPVVDPAPRKQTYPIVDQAAHKHVYPVIGRALSNFLVFLLMLLVVFTIVTAISSVLGGGTGAIDVQTTDYMIIAALSTAASLQS